MVACLRNVTTQCGRQGGRHLWWKTFINFGASSLVPQGHKSSRRKLCNTYKFSRLFNASRSTHTYNAPRFKKQPVLPSSTNVEFSSPQLINYQILMLGKFAYRSTKSPWPSIPFASPFINIFQSAELSSWQHNVM